jgi:sugar phosphate isomerase/epimerase
VPQTIPLAVQLYTLRDQIAQDFVGTVKQVAQIGYAGVEMAGFGSLKTAVEAKRALDDVGLKIVGTHVGIEALEKDINRAFDEQHALNSPTIIIPWMPEERRADAAGWKRAAQSLSPIGAKCRERGLELCYHHHSFEFQKFNGKTGMDILLENAEPGLVKIELDVYWLKHGGEDPVKFIGRVGGRAPLVHLKDMAAGPERRFAPVGAGTLDFRSILTAMRESGARWAIVEQDQCYDTPPIEAVRTSFENLQRIGVV